jgi:hypothetical protein
MNENNFERAAEQAAAFQKIWMDTMSKTFQASFANAPNSPPPEILRQMRAGIFQALAGSWDEFMRSPQFLDSIKQWMENAINFRKISNDFLARARNEMQAPARDDIDSILLNIRHLEKRVLDRLDELAAEVAALKAAAQKPFQPQALHPAPPDRAARKPGTARKPGAKTRVTS